MKYLTLFITLIFAAEMEVDGDLKVTGTVDANGNPITNVGTAMSMTDAINGNVLQSALRDDGVYEYKYYKIGWKNGQDNFVDSKFYYYEMGTSNTLGHNWLEELNALYNDGWLIKDTIVGKTNQLIDGHWCDYAVVLMSRPISEE